jgi:predicted glycosyltransferase
MISFLRDFDVSKVKNIFQFIMTEELITHRISQFIKTLEKYSIKTLVCEGFPFCRQQFAHEYFRYFEECRKRDIKIIISVRDFPWDEPHDTPLQDWVNYSQNLVCKYYAEKILVHGDPNILPLFSDRTVHSNSKAIIDDINSNLHYTGYVCDNSLPKHEKKNNIVYVCTGLNKEEGVLLFKQISKIAHRFPDYEFVMPVANKYTKLKTGKKDNMQLVEYIPNLREKLVDCAGVITYGGYNTTVEILQSSVPSIIVPRQDGQKMEQFVRAYTFEPYGFHGVINNKEFSQLEDKISKMLSTAPVEFNFSLKGVEESSNVIRSIHNG